MQFHIGPYTYKLRITPGKLIVEGVAVRACITEKDREILVSADCAPRDRLAAIIRELIDGWIFAIAQPICTAEWADLTTTLVRALLIDLRCNGGEEAIMRLQPGEGPAEMAARVALTRNRYCGVCGYTVAGGSVVCEPGPAGALRLSLYCESCNHVQEWVEIASGSGLPSGTVHGEAEYHRGPAVAEFLRAHPCASTVIIQ